MTIVIVVSRHSKKHSCTFNGLTKRC